MKASKTGKTLQVMKWSEAFADFLRRVIGIRIILLAYVMRENVVLERPLPVLSLDSPHSEENVLVEREGGVRFACTSRFSQ